ncbi:hypothetical protein P5673_022605 [Acropora cervicornis]|uniref:Uncharacterized protein n=1 Tax=Acropora cervicornis TaxID=6130 RepID=A0AAD9UZC7_ACRCE|nr:hypothetical protein P5673_022605 [Acropora cervicornis]
MALGPLTPCQNAVTYTECSTYCKNIDRAREVSNIGRIEKYFDRDECFLLYLKLELSFMETDRSLPGPLDFGMHYRIELESIPFNKLSLVERRPTIVFELSVTQLGGKIHMATETVAKRNYIQTWNRFRFELLRFSRSTSSEVTVIDSKHRRSPLVQGGLRSPSVFASNYTVSKNILVLKGYKKLVNENYKEQGLMIILTAVRKISRQFR